MELKFKGIKASRPRVARIMRSEGLKSIIKKKHRVSTTNSGHNYPVSKNILNRNFFIDFFRHCNQDQYRQVYPYQYFIIPESVAHAYACNDKNQRNRH